MLRKDDENNGRALMEIQSTCSEYAPPSLLTVQLSVSGMFEGRQSYRLTDLGNSRTRMEVDTTYTFGQWFAALMEPLITPAAEKKAEAPKPATK